MLELFINYVKRGQSGGVDGDGEEAATVDSARRQ